MTAELAILVARAARQHGLPPEFVHAIVDVESEGNPWAVRYEPAFFDRYIASNQPRPVAPCSFATELRLRATSFGLMQIMGQVAREVGFDGAFLTALCDPETGLEFGCRHLARLAQRHRADVGWEGVAAAYNAGSPRRKADGRWINEDYVEKIEKAGGFRRTPVGTDRN